MAWTTVRWVAGFAMLAGLASVFLAACFIEGCTLPYETGQAVEVPFELDAEHPIGTSWIEVSLSADALPGDVEDRGARLQLTLAGAQDVTMTLVPEGTDEPAALIASQGVASLPLDRCRPDEPCTVRALAVIEWTRPQAAASVAVGMTVEGLARVPHTRDRCGLPGDAVAVTADPPVARPVAASDAVEGGRLDVTELRRHVTVRFGAGVPTSGGTGAASGNEMVVARGHVGLTPDAEPPSSGGTGVPGMWLRVTPDDGGAPVLDGAVPLRYPVLPADATFPLDASCVRPCERGYWIEAAVFDPARGTWGDPETAVFGWTFDASLSAAEAPVAPDGSLTVTLDESAADAPVAPLVLRGSGDPFRVDGAHEATTLVIDATVPARPVPPFGDAIADTAISFKLTSEAVDPSMPGELWLSNGHYLGDGSTADDDADTGARGGPSTVSSPGGRPLAACAGTTGMCIARTGLVLRRYDGHFDGGAATPPFDVRWEWTVVGAPPGSTVTVRPVQGETLDAPDASPLTVPIALLVLLVGAGVVAVAIRSATHARGRTRRDPATASEDDPTGS